MTDTIAWDTFRWDSWRPEHLARRLAGIGAPWCVVGGWAIELHVGGGHREHEDLEMAVPRDRFDEVVPALAGHELYVPLGDGSGRLRPLDTAGELLAAHHQTWVLDPAAGAWRIDVLREPTADDRWVCRRDETLRLPYSEVIVRTGGGIPYLRPELVLLFKAKHTRPRDEADLEAVLPTLERERRTWLADRLERLHPGHEWLARIRP